MDKSRAEPSNGWSIYSSIESYFDGNYGLIIASKRMANKIKRISRQNAIQYLYFSFSQQSFSWYFWL